MNIAVIVLDSANQDLADISSVADGDIEDGRSHPPHSRLEAPPASVEQGLVDSQCDPPVRDLDGELLDDGGGDLRIDVLVLF